MGFYIPENIIEQTNMTSAELMLEFSVFLYQQKKLTLARAAHLSGLSRIEFQKELHSRKIPLNFSVDDLKKELKTIQKVVDARRQ